MGKLKFQPEELIYYGRRGAIGYIKEYFPIKHRYGVIVFHPTSADYYGYSECSSASLKSASKELLQGFKDGYSIYLNKEDWNEVQVKKVLQSKDIRRIKISLNTLFLDDKRIIDKLLCDKMKYKFPSFKSLKDVPFPRYWYATKEEALADVNRRM